MNKNIEESNSTQIQYRIFKLIFIFSTSHLTMSQYSTSTFLFSLFTLFCVMFGIFWWTASASWTDELDAFLNELLAEDDNLYDQVDSWISWDKKDVEVEDVVREDNEEDNADTNDSEKKKEICDNKKDDDKNWKVDCDDTACKKEKICENHDSAEEILDQMDDEKWKYVWKKQIKIKNINETSADLITTIAQFDEKDVETYRVYYSEKSLSTQKLDLIKDIAISAKSIDGDKENISLKLEKLKPKTKYYVVVSPIHPSDPTNEPLTMVTDEVSFTTKDNTPAKQEKEEPKKDDTAPAANEKKTPSANEKVFSNVTYTNTDNTINLNWDSGIEWIDKVEVHLRHQWESSYSNIWTPLFKAWKFTFNVDKSWNYFLKLKWVDKTGNSAWREHIQTVKVASVTAPTNNPEPVVTNPPKVWPTTDIMIWLIILWIIFYMMYRFRKTR